MKKLLLFLTIAIFLIQVSGQAQGMGFGQRATVEERVKRIKIGRAHV